MISFADIKNAFGKRVTITAALPYVNGVKHLGNLVGSFLPADVFHRFLDMFGVDNIFICGTDDHGTAIEIAAAEEGLSPKEYVAKYYKIQKDIYEKWNFSFTHFGQTSDSTNHEITQDLFLSAHKNGFVEKGRIIIPYCENCRRSLPDRYILGTCPECGYEHARGDQCEKCGKVLDPADLKNPVCNICKKSAITLKDQEHLFLSLTVLEERLRKWIETKDWPANTKNFSLGWIKEGLKPRCITRSIEWGIKVPLKGYEHLVFYVWFDAPIGYISITKQAFREGKIKRWKEYWTDSDIYHFIGKDNIPFHTIFWPGILMAAENKTSIDGHGNFLLPHWVQGYEYLNWGGQKFSTSKGIGLFSDEALKLFPADYWRFYLVSILPDTRDSNFEWEDFESRINNELIANYGNLFYRITHFIEKNYGGKLPFASAGETEKQLEWHLKRTLTEVENCLIKIDLRGALKCILSLSAELNKYFQEKKPWEAQEEDVKRALYTSANVLRSISIMLWPYLPETSEKALKLLGDENLSWDDTDKFTLKQGHEIKSGLLFRKVEIKEAKRHTGKGIKESQDNINAVDGMIPLKEFQKVELKTGTISSAEDHPNADKLIVLQVDLGSEKRQLIAGLKNIYKKEDLIGRQVIVVANLEQKEMRGLKSEGMLLAAEDGTILMPEKRVRDGSRIL
ncbi:MAG: methionine--tRNA ligase [Candidatus Aenigmarchaeota archaeon]|nr:methionine--tRNA ligase [Candidatus Aenigmarchaeota archaeon]MDI6722311.1 methionine--tRNA ligase [Candidatus Aenigmarchaeota archaeon]